MPSTKQISTKSLRNKIVDLKERLIRGDISSYLWLPMQNMWVDVLRKDMSLHEVLEDVLLRNGMKIGDTTINQVKAFG